MGAVAITAPGTHVKHERSGARTDRAALGDPELDAIAAADAFNFNRRLAAGRERLAVFHPFEAAARDAVAILLQVKAIAKVQVVEGLGVGHFDARGD